MGSRTRYIIGLGPPRSGTLSLSKLLGAQSSARVTHEAAPCIPWRPSKDEKRRAAEWLQAQAEAHGARYVGDVSYAWLSVVEHLTDHLDPAPQFVGLIRHPGDWHESVDVRIDDTVLTSTERRSARQFPTYDDSEWGRYREAYYTRLLQSPGNIPLIQTSGLSCRDVQEVALRAAGIDESDRAYITDCHYNRRST